MYQDRIARFDDRQDLAGVYSRFKRHTPLGAAIIFSFVVLAIIATQFMPKKYTGKVQLAFAPQSSIIKNIADPGLSDLAREAEIEAQLQFARSLAVANQVVKTLGLAKDPEIANEAKRFKSGGADAVAAAVLDNFGARRVGQTPLIELTFTSSNPITAAKVANAFADSYLQNQVTQKLAQSKSTLGQLDARVELLRSQAESADAAVAEYRVRNNLIGNPDSVALEQEISAISTNLANARAVSAEANARRAAAGRSTIIGSNSGPIDNSTLSGLRAQRAEVVRKQGALSARYGERHPLIIDTQEELARIDGEIRYEMRGLSASAGAESSIAAARASSLAASLGSARSRLVANVRGGVGLADLERKASIAREQYQNLLGTRSQETARRALFQPDSRLVSPATPPLSASSPNLMVNIVLGFALGLAIALATAYFRERWSQCLNTIDDIDRLLGVEFLNSVPTLRSSIDAPKTNDPSEAVVLHPLSSYAEAFRSLATTLLYRARESGGGKVIGITSSLPKEGKTTTSISVARVLALSGKSVAIMDADLRRRSITQALAPDAAKGWVEVVEGSATLKDVLIVDGTGATLVPAAPNAHLAASPFSGPAFEQLMQDLRRSFDVIVVDTAPVLAVDDTRVLLGHLDALAMLARWRQTPVKAIRAALHQVRSVGGTVVGVAMTMVDLKNQARSGYGDASDYYADMKEYYATE